MKTPEIPYQLFTLPLKEPPAGPHRTETSVRVNYPVLSRWLKSLSPGERREYNAEKQRALTLTGARSRHELVSFINDHSIQTSVINRANNLLASMFGVKNGSLDGSLDRYAEQANTVINTNRAIFPSDLSGSMEIVNEIERAKHPARLIGIIFDPRYAVKGKFEAWRKLELMHRALLNERSSERGRVDEQLDSFTDFMNEAGVWLPETKIGEFNNVYLLSHHNPRDNFRCVSVDVLEISPEEAEEMIKKLPKGEKITQVSRRKFQIQKGPQKGRIVSIYISNDRKDTVAEITKSIRKKELIPDKAIDDRIRTRVVADNVEDLNLFLDHIRLCAERFGSDLMIDDISDTLNGGTYKGGSAGSSPQWQALKFFLTVAGARIELEGFTNISFINSEYRRGISHPEFAVKRLFQPEGESAIEWFFPPKAYRYNPKVALKRIISKVRRDIEEPIPYPTDLLRKASNTLTALTNHAISGGRHVLKFARDRRAS